MTPKDPKHPLNHYRKTDVLTANKETILLMMYSGAIRFLKQGIEANDQGNVAERTRYVKKTLDIVNELRSVLNFEVGGEIAINLDRLYSFVAHRLIEGNMQKNSELFKEALSVLTTLNEAWEQAISSLKKENSTDQTVPKANSSESK